MTPYLLGYLAAVNALALALMGADKRRAKKALRRIPERTLFLTAIIGGSVGAILGMWTFHHKTKHWYFVYGMPLILLLQLVASFFLLTR